MARLRLAEHLLYVSRLRLRRREAVRFANSRSENPAKLGFAT